MYTYNLESETKVVLLNKIVDYIWRKPVSTQAISVTALVASVNSMNLTVVIAHYVIASQAVK